MNIPNLKQLSAEIQLRDALRALDDAQGALEVAMLQLSHDRAFVRYIGAGE